MPTSASTNERSSKIEKKSIYLSHTYCKQMNLIPEFPYTRARNMQYSCTLLFLLMMETFAEC